MDKTDSSSISTKDKIEIIAKHIGDDFGEKEVMRFRGAVTVYASTGRDCYQRKEKAPLAKMWDKTKELLDEERDEREDSPNKFLETIKRLHAKEVAKEQQWLDHLSEATDMSPDEITIALNRMPWLKDEEERSKTLSAAPEFGGFEELFEHMATGQESFLSSYLYDNIKTAQGNAAKHGNHFTFDEMAEMLSMCTKCCEEKDWLAWEQLLHKMYNAPTPHADMAWLDELDEDEDVENEAEYHYEPTEDSPVFRQHISDVISFDEFTPGKINLIFSPCGSGKTTFMETMLKEYAKGRPQEILHLSPTCALRDMVNAHNPASSTTELPNGRVLKGPKQSGITAITYAMFGHLIEQEKEKGTYNRDKWWGKNAVICLDEIQQAVNQLYYDKKRDNITKTALEELIKRSEDDSNLVIAFSATPSSAVSFIVEHFHWKKSGINVVKSVLDLKGYRANQTIEYKNLNQLIKQLDPSKRGMIYIDTISQIKDAVSQLEAKGIPSVGIWSVRSNQRMSDKQWETVDSLVNNDAIPNDVQVLVLNAAYQTGLNIDPRKSHLDYVIVHSANKDTQTQARGRYRGDIDTVYLKTNDDAHEEINSDDVLPFLDRELTKADKDRLCETIGFVDSRGRLYKWPTIKKLLIQQGYSITEKKSGSKRSTIIKRRDGKQ